MGYFAALLTTAFVVLKIVGVISWSWWLVLLPAILSVGFHVTIFLVLLAVAVKDEVARRKNR